MPTLIIMDRRGDTRHHFTDAAAAEKRFRELTQRGFTAVALGENAAENRVLTRFDQEVERNLFMPQLVGG